MTTKSLVMWSGGLDSTYGLVRLLSETKDDVYAHHIDRNALHDSGKRTAPTCEYEAEAIEKMRPYIASTYRSFHYSESAVDLTAFETFARDTTTSMFFAAHVAKSYGFTRMDRILLSMNSDEDSQWNPGSELYSFLRMTTIQVMKLVWGSEDVPQCFLWPEPPTKQIEADYLPIDLFWMTASCRDPEPSGEDWKLCGTCPECVTLSSVRHHALNSQVEDTL